MARTAQLNVSLSPADKAHIQQAAKLRGVSVSRLVRESVLGSGAVDVVARLDEHGEQFAEVDRRLARLEEVAGL